jgi:hypothetical protein
MDRVKKRVHKIIVQVFFFTYFYVLMLVVAQSTTFLKAKSSTFPKRFLGFEID